MKLFKSNKYTNIYNKIIENAKLRDIDCYTENHHIIPRSLGGTDDSSNLVKLNAREHYICHLLLPKMLDGEPKYKMLCAIIRMAHSNQAQRIKMRSRTYERVKLEKAAMHSIMFRGENNPFYGKKHSEETKQKLREARARQVERQGSTMTESARQKLSSSAKGRIFSQNHITKISLANKGKKRSQECKDATSARMSGHIKSEATLQKLREKANTGPKLQITCPHCNKVGGAPSMTRWHFDKCKILKVNITQ